MSALDVQVGGSHYMQGSIQPIQFIEAYRLQYLEASVVKRCARHDKETGKGRQDIEKAIHELELLLELRYPIAPPAQDVAPVNIAEAIKNLPKDLYGLLQPGDCFICGPGVRHGGLPCPGTAPASVTVPPYVYSQ